MEVLSYEGGFGASVYYILRFNTLFPRYTHRLGLGFSCLWIIINGLELISAVSSTYIHIDC